MIYCYNAIIFYVIISPKNYRAREGLYIKIHKVEGINNIQYIYLCVYIINDK